MPELKNELKENKILLVIIPNTTYKDTVVKLAGDLFQIGCVHYISLNKTVKSLKEIFSKQKIKCDGSYYIDAISNTIGKPEKEDRCIFVSSPNALTEVGLAIKKSGDHKDDILFFDSLSTLLIYHKDIMATKFAHSIINKLRASDKYGVFTILEKDKDTLVSKDVGMLVDKIITLN